MVSSHLPAPREFTPSEVSAILRRAIVVASDVPGAGDHLTARDIAAVAEEVGVPPAAVATALAESRAGLDDRPGVVGRAVDRVVGPSKVWANGRTSGDEQTATEIVRRWLEVDHGLATHVRGDGVVVASRRGGLTGAVGSAVRRIGGRGGLDRARSVRAATATIDQDGVVCIVADVANKRTEAIAGGSVVAGGSMMLVGLVAVVTTPAVLMALPAAAAVGVGTARVAHRRTVARVTGQVEATTHAAARDEVPRHPVERLLRSGVARRRPPPRRRD